MICFFCGRDLQTYAKLAAHLLEKHTGQRIQGGQNPLADAPITGSKHHLCMCWCGRLVSKQGRGPYLALSQHLKNRGGLDAHLLEIALGNQ